MQRTHVLLLFGGESAEHEVSIASARNVFAALDDSKFETSLGYIDSEGKWWLVKNIDGADSLHGKPQLVPVLGTKQFVTIPTTTVLQPDVILPVLHGAFGEDGTIQGLAALMHVPVVGPRILGAALTIDKDVAKRLLRLADVPVVDWVTHRIGDELPDFNALTTQLGSPLFVKPARSGSSVGVSRVFNEEEFERAVQEAKAYDSKLLIERAVTGRELEVAVLGNENPKITVAGEIKANADFYTYYAKYDPDSKAEVTIPAQDVSDETQAKLKETALKAYGLLECKGMARVDFFLTDDGQIYVNELNTIPGFTNISMYPKLWRHEGMRYGELIEELVSLARKDPGQIY
jgi:D-alanine-D-alanine ligase